MSQTILLRSIMHEIFECDLFEINADAKINQVSGWDSLNHINLMMRLIELGVPIEISHIADLTNFAAVRHHIENAGLTIGDE